MPNEQPTEKKGSKVPDHVPVYEHFCKQHGWERCAVAASLVDPTKEAQHACSSKLDMPERRVPFRAVAREIQEKVLGA